MKNDNYAIEVCANSAYSGIMAQKGGATRIELCAGIPEGGTTPSYGEIKAAKENLDIVLNVIIRPRSGDFLYSPLEIEIMKNDIRMCKQIGVDGVVFGCLTPDGDIDIALCETLMKEAEGLSVTFHRAFDVCRSPFESLEQIIDMGFDRILTSGQQPTAFQGRELIAELQKKAAGRIIIMPGCGVNETNIDELCNTTGCFEFHTSARCSIPSAMIYKNENVSMGGEVKISEFANNVTSPERVNQCVEILTYKNLT